jgi:hypothetical protein
VYSGLSSTYVILTCSVRIPVRTLVFVPPRRYLERPRLCHIRFSANGFRSVTQLSTFHSNLYSVPLPSPLYLTRLPSTGMTSSPEEVLHSANELTVPLETRRRVSIASDPPTIVDGRLGGQETRRRLSAASSDHPGSDGRRKSILVQHTPDTMSVHSHNSGNSHYVNHAFQQDGEHVAFQPVESACVQCRDYVDWHRVVW